MQSGYSAIQSKESAKKSHRYGLTCENKKQLVPSSMIFLSLFLILTSNTMMCAEANDISMNADTNEIVRTNTKAIRRADTGKHINENETQRIERWHVSENTFKAFECNEESDLSTAEFSLNEAPACRRSDGSAYHLPEPKKAQILQKFQRIPVEVTICQVNLRITVG